MTAPGLRSTQHTREEPRVIARSPQPPAHPFCVWWHPTSNSDLTTRWFWNRGTPVTWSHLVNQPFVSPCWKPCRERPTISCPFMVMATQNPPSKKTESPIVSSSRKSLTPVALEVLSRIDSGQFIAPGRDDAHAAGSNTASTRPLKACRHHQHDPSSAAPTHSLAEERVVAASHVQAIFMCRNHVMPDDIATASCAALGN